MGDYVEEVLWLSSAQALHDRSVTHVILYPVVELRALAFIPQSGSDDLDPFERAVLGSCTSGVATVQEQAELLGLHPDFVGHLQVRLRDRGLIDERGTPMSNRVREGERQQAVINLYWDPHVERLWPRFSASNTRRSVSVSGGRTSNEVNAGDDGDPYTIAAFDLQRTRRSAPEVAVEDCLDAVRSWSRDLRRLNRRDEAIERPSLAVLDERHEVRLCIPVHHLRSSKAVLQDPFAGPQWPHMLRTLTGIAETNRGLHSWLRVQESAEEFEHYWAAHEGSPAVLLEELEELNDRARGPLPERAQIQVRLDLVDLGHRLIDELEARSTRDEPLRAGTTACYRDKAAAMFGFALDPAAAPIPVPAGDDDLSSRILALLDRFQPGIPGALHRVAARWPGLLAAVADSGSVSDVSTLLNVASALAAAMLPEATATNPDLRNDFQNPRNPHVH